MKADKKLIDRFFKGQCTEDEVQAIMQWMHSSLAEEQLSDEIENLWQSEADDEQAADEWDGNRLKTNTIRKIFGEDSINTTKHFSRSTPWRWMAAAMFLILLSIGVLYFAEHQTQNVVIQEQTALVTKHNPKGQKSRVFLPDGSVVWLNSESDLTYPADFDGSTRNIWLIGEAFFEVTKDPSKPFIVNAGNTATRVLGTRFNVKAYPEDQDILVALVEGKVSVDQENGAGVIKSITLKPGEAVAASLKQRDMRKFKYDPEQHTAWKDGVLNFSKAKMMTVIKALERWYGVSITVKNLQEDNWSFSGSFRDEYLSNVLNNLMFTREFNYEINNKEVVITFK